jgi:hypothetical protein
MFACTLCMRHALNALERLSAAMRDAESALAAMKAEHDPLASHIFISRRHYRNANDTKGGKRREMNARLSFNTACELGFHGSLDEWERLIGAITGSVATRNAANRRSNRQRCVGPPLDCGVCQDSRPVGGAKGVCSNRQRIATRANGKPPKTAN